jgi:hypothetical protein
MPFSGLLRHVALVRTEFSEEISASVIRVTSVRQFLVTANIVASSPIFMEALSSSETSILTEAIWRSIPEDYIFSCVSCKLLTPLNIPP